MIISSQELNSLPVFTQGGQALGKVSGFELNAETGRIDVFFVKTGLIKGLLNQQLSIGFDQVISIDREKMVVSDSVGKIPVVGLADANISS